MKFTWKGKSASAGLALIGAAVSTAALIGFCLYGAVYNEYFDLLIAGFLLLSAVGSAAYSQIDQKATELLNLASVFLTTFALGLFVLNSYEVWADWYGNFDMYGSRGGIVPVVILYVLFLAAIFCNMVSCFMRKDAKQQEA